MSVSNPNYNNVNSSEMTATLAALSHDTPKVVATSRKW